jgi:hypothetical protein
VLVYPGVWILRSIRYIASFRVISVGHPFRCAYLSVSCGSVITSRFDDLTVSDIGSSMTAWAEANGARIFNNLYPAVNADDLLHSVVFTRTPAIASLRGLCSRASRTLFALGAALIAIGLLGLTAAVIVFRRRRSRMQVPLRTS